MKTNDEIYERFNDVIRVIFLTSVIIVLVIGALGFLIMDAHAECPKGDSEWKDGVCTVDIQPEQAVQTYKPSDEKPPKDKMPSYEREGIHVVDAKSGVEPDTSTAHDYQAESGEGKRP